MRSKDLLFIAMTRPPMIAVVTFLFMGVNAFGVAILYTSTQNLLVLPLVLPIHAVGYMMCMKDPRLMDVIVKRAQKSSGVPNKDYWGGKSYER